MLFSGALGAEVPGVAERIHSYWSGSRTWERGDKAADASTSTKRCNQLSTDIDDVKERPLE